MIAGRSACAVSAAEQSAPSALRRRWIARAWSCETRDSFTPISAPICFIVASRVVVHPDDLALARRQRPDRGANAVAHLVLFVGAVRRRRLGRHERRGQRGAVDVVAGRQRRRRLDRVDADDRAAEPRFVRAHAGGQIGQRRLCAELAPQLLRARPRARAAGAGRLAARRPGASASIIAPRTRRSANVSNLMPRCLRRSGSPRRSGRACRPAPGRPARSNAASRTRRGGRAIRRTADRRRSVRADRASKRLALHGPDSPWPRHRAAGGEPNAQRGYQDRNRKKSECSNRWGFLLLSNCER